MANQLYEPVVQVVFGRVNRSRPNGGHSHTYSYRVPDWLWFRFSFKRWMTVVVPSNWAHGEEQLATVVEFGRGTYDGPLTDIAGVVQRPLDLPLSPADPRVFSEGFEQGTYKKSVTAELRRRIMQLEEVVFLQLEEMVFPREKESHDALMKRIERIERFVGLGGPYPAPKRPGLGID